MKKPDFAVIDGNNMAWRMYHAFSRLQYDGRKVGLLHGSLVEVQECVRAYGHRNFVVAFDGVNGKAERLKLFPDYKAGREPPKEDFIWQFNMLRKILIALDVPVFYKDHVEGDDAIGVLAKQAVKSGNYGIVTIRSTDKDFSQFVRENELTLYNPTAKVHFQSAKDVRAKHGVPPSRFAEYLALVGDKVDGIPGVHKCGPDKAQKILREYKSLELFVEALKNRTAHERWINLVEDYPERILTYLQLTTIPSEHPDVSLARVLKTSKPDKERAYRFMEKYRMKTALGMWKGQSKEVAKAVGTKSLFGSKK